MARVAPADMPLEDFQAHVRKVALKVQARQGWSDDGLNTVLRDLGLREKKVTRVTVEVALTRRGTVVLTDADSEEEAIARVAAMTPQQLVEAGAFKNLGGYGSHRVLTREELSATDDFAALGQGDRTDAVRAERDANPGLEYCGQRGPSREWVCSRITGHTGTHIAMSGREVLENWQEGEGTS
jgi:hypothetical protein